MKTVTINSRKFNGKIHRSWHAELIQEDAQKLVFVGEFENEVRHPHLGVIRPGTISYEFYWKNDWFNIFRFHEPEGRLRNFYCNINKPPTFKKNVLDYIDLDIDVLVWQDFSFEVLDLEEFKENSRDFNYSVELKKRVRYSLSKIINLIENRKFPFDFTED